jgi:hypothetical protein
MKPALLHVSWLAVAAGAFYAGSVLKKPAPDGTASTNRNLNVASGNLTAAERAGSVKTSAISRDASIADFLSRYELGNGKPLSSEKMRQAMTEALRETDPVKSTMLFARLLEEMTPENAAESMATLRESISGFEMMRYMPLLAYQWGSVDATGALASLDAQGNGGGRENMFAKPVVLAGLASKDPAAAQKWLADQPADMPGKEWYTQSIINGLAKSDPEAAIALAAKQEKVEDRSRAAETIAQEKIKSGIDSAAAWASSLTDPDMKKGAMQTVVNQMARTDLTKAAEYVKQYGNDPSASSAVEDVAQRMARSNPADALKFAEGLSGSNQPVAYRETIQSWTRTDSEAASKYVNAMPAGTNRDASASALASSISREDPAAAIAWTGSIADPKVREETLIDVARDYRRTDPEGYAAWLPASGLSTEAQQQVNERGGDRGWRGGPPGGFGGGPPGGFGRGR